MIFPSRPQGSSQPQAQVPTHTSSPVPENEVKESFARLAFDSHGTRILLVTFALIIFLAVTGMVLTAFLDADDSLFHDAIRIIGIGGPASTGADSISGAIGRRLNGGNR